MATIRIKDTEYFYQLQGRGHPVVLISGYTCDHSLWLPIADELSKKYQILLFDNRAAGQTKDNHQPLSAEIMAADTIALCDQLKLIHPHIIGHSMGGTIAQTIAATYPKKIAKLVILNSSVKWRQAMLFAVKNILFMRENNFAMDVIFNTLTPWIYGENFLLDPTAVENYKQLLFADPNQQSIADQARQFEVLKNFDGRTQLKDIKAETLVVYGLQDILALPIESIFLANTILRGTLVKLECAHASIREVPQEVLQVVMEFFQ